MAAPMSAFSSEPCDGHPILIAVAVTSTGATAETCTIPAGLPPIDLTRSHPVISMMHLVTEDDTTASSDVFFPSSECARAATPDSAGEWAIATATTIAFYSGVDKNGTLFISYFPMGVKHT